MKALNLQAVGDLRYETVADVSPAEGEVLLKIKACGICGSDIPRVLKKGTYHFPTIPGHEFSGEVVEIGKNVDAALLGRRAAVFPLLPCRKCDMCELGEYAQCENYNYFGSRCDGGFAEYIAVPVWNLCLAEDSVDYRVLAMAEPCAVALHALRQAGLAVGDTLCIFGAGPIGIMAAQWGRLWGASKVILLDIDEKKCSFARRLGFSHVFCGAGKNAADYVAESTGGKGADVVIEGAGVSSSLETAMFAAKYFGSVVLLGNPSGDMSLTQQGYWQIMRKQLHLLGTWNSAYQSFCGDWKLVVGAMNEGKLDLLPLISHEYRLEDGMKPFEMIASKKEFFNKVMYIME